jgi:hypothetical protein
MFHFLCTAPILIGTVSWQARGFTLTLGLGLGLWSLTKLRSRSLLVSICSVFIAIALGLISFSVTPGLFDTFAYAVGVQYPPLAYLVVTILILMVTILMLAIKVSTVDERCRRLAQELALTRQSDLHKP